MHLIKASLATTLVLCAANCAGRSTAVATPPPPSPELFEAAEPSALSGSAFAPGCDVPFGSIGEVRPIDNSCGPEGSGSAASKLQNAAKNNFCAKGPVVNVNRQTLERLQTAVNAMTDLNWGTPTNLPDDRTPLKNVITVSGQSVGESTLVRARVYLMHANYSNTSSGENVNCKETGQANNDIHMYLAFQRDEDDRCEGLNAEISPHFRPELWEEIVDVHIHPNRPLRITGQLFFDASHRPCEGGKRASPNRFTSWEIHPVYNMEVCRFKSESNCRIGTDADWIPFDEWLGEDEGDGLNFLTVLH